MRGEERDDWALADIGKRLMGGAVVVGASSGRREGGGKRSAEG